VDPRPNLEALLSLSPTVVARLREAMQSAGFSEAIIGEAEAVAPGLLDPIRLPLVHQWLRGREEPAAAWARLFAYRDHVGESEVRRLIGEATLTALTEAGVLLRERDGVVSRLRLMPFAGLIIASDEVAARFDPVMGPGATTLELWRAVQVQAGASVLDVGCGAGSLALAAARAGASTVVGTDIDPRAADYGRFNARINGLSDATFVVGDRLDPVAGQRFDLVVAQPPFVPRPPSIAATTYLHGGERGDELAWSIIDALPDVLAAGGRAVVLFDAAPAGGEHPLAILRARLGGKGLQVTAVVAPGLSADQQAVGYASTAHGELGPDYARAAASYRAHLALLGIDAMRHVLLEIRRVDAGASGFIAGVDTPRAKLYAASELDALRRGVELAMSPALPKLRLRACAAAWLGQERRLQDREAVRYRLRFDEGRTTDQELSDAAAALVERFADEAEVAEVVAQYAELCGVAPAEVEGAVLQFVRESLVNGLLVPGRNTGAASGV